MLHLYDRATMAHALTLDLDPHLRALLAARIAALHTESGDLTDWTEFVIVEPGDTEEEMIRAIGFSPLVEPIDGVRFGKPGFHPYWEWLADHDGWYEMIVTFGSTFAYILLICDAESTLSCLRRLCRTYSRER